MRRLRDLDARLDGLPFRGTHSGGGRHVELGDTPRPGWSIYRWDMRQHPTKQLWAYPVADLGRDRADKANMLSPAERATIDGAVSTAKVLPAEWDDEVIATRVIA